MNNKNTTVINFIQVLLDLDPKVAYMIAELKHCL